MCMNCGCGQPHEDHGNPANITAGDLQRSGEANHQSLRESAQHIIETVALLDASRRGDPGVANPGAAGATAAAPADQRGTPATES